MTSTRRRSQLTAGSQTISTVTADLMARSPRPAHPLVGADIGNAEAELAAELRDLSEALGEQWIGGPWHPNDDPYRAQQRHAREDLDQIRDRRADLLARRLRT